MYDPLNNFWLADDHRVYGSKNQITTDDTDPDFVAWSESNAATPWPRDEAGDQTVAALQEVLKPYNIWIDLAAYSADARYRKASGGLVVTSLSPVPFYTDPVSRNTIANAYEYIKETPGNTVDWKLSDGTFIVLNEAGLDKAVTSIASFIQSCFTVESQNLTAINGGTMTTTAQVDAAYNAIPTTVP